MVFHKVCPFLKVEVMKVYRLEGKRVTDKKKRERRWSVGTNDSKKGPALGVGEGIKW